MKSTDEEYDIIWEGSCYVAYGIYDLQLASLVANLIEKHGPIPRESEGFISVGEGVVSVSRDLYDVDPYGGYGIFAASQTVCIELSEEQVKSDEKKALTADKIISALDGFFTPDFPDAQAHALVSKAVKENGAVCRVYFSSDFYSTDYSYMALELKKNRETKISTNIKTKPTISKWSAVCDDVTVEYKDKIFVLTGFDKETEEEPLEKHIVSRGGIVKGSVVLNTDYLVVNLNYRGAETTKYKRALELIERGKNIHIISGAKFFAESGVKAIAEKFDVEDGVLVGYKSKNMDVSVPEGVTEIGEDSFSEMGIHSITLPEGVREIGSMAFCQCEELESITLPASLQRIGDGAFAGCNSLSKVIIHPDNPYYTVKDSSIYSKDGKVLVYHFNGEREEAPFIPNGVAEIGAYAFTAQNVKRLNLPGSVTKIGDWAFWSSKLCGELIIPEGVTEIGENAFLCCGGITSVHIPQSVTKIATEAFSCCNSLGSITILSADAEIEKDAFGFGNKITLYVPKNASLKLIAQLNDIAKTIKYLE